MNMTRSSARWGARPVPGKRLTRRPTAAAALALVLCWASPVGAGARAQDAGEFVRKLGDEVVAVLKDQSRDLASRREALRAVFLASFDSKAIARFVLGRYWRVATEAQKARYLSVFPTYVADIYAGQLSKYSGEEFVVLRERQIDTSRVYVDTEIRRPDRVPLKVDFRVHRTEDGFRTFDVFVEGISLLITKRDEFATVIRRNGLDGLLTLLERRTEGMIER